MDQSKFWDEFAKDYTEIQVETQTTIVTDTVSFLKNCGWLPCDTFLDLAGGSGKYVGAILPEVVGYTLVDFSPQMLKIAKKTFTDAALELVCQDQQLFFEQTPDEKYDLLFSAMNPALRTAEDIEQCLRIAKKAACILRVVKEEDELFSPYEEPDADLVLMEQYKNFLTQPYISHVFEYHYSESISKEFFKSYFAGDLSENLLNEALRPFLKNKVLENVTTICFELLVIPKIKQ